MKQKLFLLIIFSALIANAQLKEKYEKGWIIKTNNVKIEGYIKADDLSKLSSGICFKLKLEDKNCQPYNKTQILAFQKDNNDTFDLLNLKINNDKNEIDVFANLIFKGGKLSLYKSIYQSEIFYVLSKDGENYVLQNDKLTPGELTIKKYNFRGKLNILTDGLAFSEKPSLDFDEDDFIDIIAKYNNSKKTKSEDLRKKEKSIAFFVINGGFGTKKRGSEYYGQVFYRKYYPKISRSTSLNLGINYFNYTSKDQDENFTQSLTSAPLQLQQNILTKKIRPYVFVGFSLNYLRLEDEDGNSILEERFNGSYGVSLLYGAGIEMDVFKGFYLKTEYRVEAYFHPINFGIGYIFKRHSKNKTP